ncbi:MAG: hypothetical protein LBU82_00505 [Treponema sp.]|jgi:hypothetical protein|nr:hypothetical protein [Treponema sp.]
MKRKVSVLFCIASFLAAVIFSNCATARQYDFTLKDTLSIFLLNNGKDYYFCIPVQYMGDYHIGNFEFTGGYVQIGNAYNILLKRDEVNIYAYLNEDADESGGMNGLFNIIYSEEKGKLLVNKMGGPLKAKNESDDKYNHYYFFIEKHLDNNEMKKMIGEYKKGNVNSKMYIEYDITIDSELQAGSGMLDDFELYDGPGIDPAWFPPNLDFFKAKYL